jgi:hypothetical protein
VYSVSCEGRKYEVTLNIVDGSPISVQASPGKFPWAIWKNNKPPAASSVAAHVIQEAQEQRREWRQEPSEPSEIDENEDGAEEESEADADEDEPGSPPVIPPWCKPGKLQVRVALLLEAITAAGPAGLHIYDDIRPLDMSEAASDRGIAAQVKLMMPKDTAPVIQVGERAYLRRFAPGAERETAREAVTEGVSAESPPATGSTVLSPVLAKLQAAGANGMSAFELMRTEGFDPVSLAAALAPLASAGNVTERDGRYFYRMSEAE